MAKLREKLESDQKPSSELPGLRAASPSSLMSWHTWERTIFLGHIWQLAQGLRHSVSTLEAEGIRLLPLAAHHHMPAGELCSRLGLQG